MGGRPFLPRARIVTATVLIGIMVLVGGVSGTTSISGCDTLNSAGETYILNNDISSNGTCFTISADDITLNCQAHSITGMDIWWSYGVYINGKSGITIKNCILKDYSAGIFLSFSNNNTIKDNDISSNDYAGIWLYHASSNDILNSTFINNGYGMKLETSCNFNNITNNNVSYSGEGITIEESSNNIISENYIFSSNFTGVRFFVSANSKNNTVYHNNFISNAGYFDDGSNIWDFGYLSGGNYWSDFDSAAEGCNDVNLDGICDSIYNVSGGNNTDRYPVISQNGWDRPIHNLVSGLSFVSIQAAVNNATAGDTITVDPGIYNENIDVDKSINLIGAGAGVTIVNASNSSDHVFEIGADWVNLSGFTITNSNHSDVSGIYIQNKDHINLSNNAILHNGRLDDHSSGIYSMNSSDVQIINNNISGFDDGIYLNKFNLGLIYSNTIENNGFGLTMIDSSHNPIQNNSFKENVDDTAIQLLNSSSNNITKNYFINDEIRLQGSSNYIFKNDFIGKGNFPAIEFQTDFNNNLVYHNNFINVSKPEEYGTNNTWDSGYPGGGNYWSDYSGSDSNNDGIGDAPYSISGGGNLDNYPFMSESGWINSRVVVNNTSPSCTTGKSYFSTIQAAVDANSGVSTIVVCGGTYNENVDVNKSVNLVGEGSAVTIIEHALGSNWTSPTFNVIADRVNISGFTITSGFCFSTYGIYLNNVAEGRIFNNDVSVNALGIYLNNSSNNTITNNTAHTTCSEGIYLYSGSNNNIITNNNISQNNNFGIRLFSSFNNTLKNNTVNANDHGIQLYYSQNNVIENNTVKNNYYYNIHPVLNSSDDCKNIIGNNTGTGDVPITYFNSSVTFQNEEVSELILCNADNSTLNNVTIEGSVTNKKTGILVIETDYSNFTNIDSFNNNRHGIRFENSNFNIIANINVSGNLVGIHIKNSNNNIVTNNTASNNSFGIRIEASDFNVIANNTASNNSLHGFSIMDYDDDGSNYNDIRENTASNNGLYGVRSASNYNNIVENVFSDNGEMGIYLYVSDFNTIIANTVSNHSDYGVYFYFSSNNTIYNNNFINNTNQAYNNGNNTWHNGHPDGGNYWSNYDETSEGCNDANTDGFCDSPYNVSGGNNQDNYPFVNQDGWGDIRDTGNGTNVSITFPGCGMNMTFGRIVGTGKTTCIKPHRSSGITPPSGYKSAGIFYNLTTTANFTGNLEICVTDFDILPTYRLFHWAGTWGDITTRVDAGNDTLCGTVDSLSPFEVMEPSSDSGSSGSSGGASKPKIILLANSIDYNLSANFTSLLKTNGIDITYTTPENFSSYNTSKFIVILGGPDAHDGVGEIVREVLSESGQSHLRTKGNRKMYVNTNVWARGQVVMIIAGSDRGQTRQAGEENKLAVKTKVKGY